MLLTMSILFAGLGLGLAAYGLAASRAVLADGALVVVDEPVPVGTEAGLVYRVVEPVVEAVVELVRRVSPTRRLDLARERIVHAGLEGTLTLEKVLSYKAGAAVAGLLAGLLGGPGSVPRLVWAAALAVGASFVPDVLLSSKADKRQADVGRALPDALDLLALTVEAGLGFEQGLEVVVDNTTGPLAGEFARLLREVELGVPRREALNGLRDRTSVPELSAFVVALVQSDQMGVALSEVLKAQAAQVRLKRRQRAKERAAKTPVKIMVPVVLGIFPALFVVTIGPGALAIVQNVL
ncbi:MAG: type secretion system protein [Frankiales bacterium]|nr:type secretion system protein [Frankiales bacterium]